MHAGQWIVVVLCLIIGLYLLTTGLIAIRFKKMTVVNPEHASAWPGLLGALIRMERNKGIPTWRIDDGNRSKSIHGGEAFARGIFNTIFGIAVLAVGAAYVWVEMFQ
jgi:hypothetical protein